MGLLTGLFGGADNAVVTVLLGLGIVLLLIVLGVWGLKLLFTATGNVSRGRNKRLMIVDAAPVDQRRQLVLIRRDNVEHLLLVGGAQELVIETSIEPVEQPVPARAPRRSPIEKAAAMARRREPAATEPRLKTRVETTESSTAGTGASASEKLRDLGRPLSERRSTSLRHTGLLRPVSRMEPALIPMEDGNTQPETEANAPDSDKPAPVDAVMNGSAEHYNEPQVADDNSGDNAVENHDDKPGQGG